MAVLRIKEARKMNVKDMDEKLNDLKMELTKANVTSKKTNAKTKEIKRAIARLLTLKSEKRKEERKK